MRRKMGTFQETVALIRERNQNGGEKWGKAKQLQ